ncbi:MAG: Gx transporter family protein [Lachnospiraceae bacterium]|nr:Gx transporter family protein [Lachnospiraceae bacterium]
MKQRQLSAKTIALLAMMIALAIVFSYVESLIPINFGIPGVKLGLANLVIVATLYLMGGRQALIVSVVRIILSGLLFGNMFSILYSLAGGLLSLGIMVLIKRTDKVSVITVSVMGGIFHNIGQLIVAMIVIENLNLVFYLPVLLLSGFLTGLVIGIVSRLILPRIKRVFPEQANS